MYDLAKSDKGLGDGGDTDGFGLFTCSFGSQGLGSLSWAECQFCRWRVGNTEGYIKYVIKHKEFSPVKSFWCEFQHHR